MARNTSWQIFALAAHEEERRAEYLLQLSQLSNRLKRLVIRRKALIESAKQIEDKNIKEKERVKINAFVEPINKILHEFDNVSKKFNSHKQLLKDRKKFEYISEKDF